MLKPDLFSKASAVSCLASAIAIVSCHGAAFADTQQGVTFRIYKLDDDIKKIPTLIEGQTPNYDEVRPTIDFGNSGFGGISAPFVSHVIGELFIDEPGDYQFRLTSDDGSRLWLDNRVIVDHDGNHSASPMQGDTVHIDEGYHKLFVEHFDHTGDRSLKLEWSPPSTYDFSVIPSDHLRTEVDLTRVTSPGAKRIEGGTRPGDRRPLAGVHPGWKVTTIRPEGFEPKVGAMTFLPDGRLVVGTFDPLQRDDRSLPDIQSKEPDALYALSNLDAEDPKDIRVERIAGDLFEPMGLCVVDDELYVAQRLSVERLLDKDSDGFYETHETVGSGWEGWNYHQFAMGLVHKDGKLYTALSTSMAPPGWEGQETNSSNNGPMRGCVLEIDIATGLTRVIAGGLRTPNGLGFTANNELVYLDNQGTWMPTSQLAEIIPGRFYGHYNWTHFVPNLKDRFPEGGFPSAYDDHPRTHAAVLMPHNEISNSPTQPLPITEGPFKGQLLVGELTAGGIRRMSLERVNGVLQGAVFRFTQGFEGGINRMAWAPDGSLCVGSIGAGGNWNWRGTQYGLQKLTPTGEDAFEMKTVTATPTGFRIEFTDRVDEAWLSDPANFIVRSWTYTPTSAYGGPKVDEYTHSVTASEASEGGLAVTITLDDVTPGRCYAIRTDPKNTEGEEIWSTEAWYTMNQVPQAGGFAPSTIYEEPITLGSIGVGALPPADGVQLLGQAAPPAAMKYEGKPYPPAPITQNDLIESEGSAPVGKGSGDLVSTTSFADARIHIEWLVPPGGLGQIRGNSGVYLQDYYELQVLGTLAGSDALNNNEAGSLYRFKAPDTNASTGPGSWQAFDIWFRAARFRGYKKTEDAQITVYWNGQLVHSDVVLPSGTGSKASAREFASNGRSFQIGPLRLQDHPSAAKGPVRFRNVWMAPLEDVAYESGDWVSLFEDLSEDDWMVRGGNATFETKDNQLTGTSVPNSPNTFYTTVQEYSDFELVYEARVDPALNSGVQIRSEVIGGDRKRSGGLKGYQVELDPSDRAYTAGIYEEQDRGWLFPLTTTPYARRAFRKNEWNEIRIVAKGPVIQTWINGVPAASIFDAARESGHIGFQVHDVGNNETPMKTEFRNARLRELFPG